MLVQWRFKVVQDFARDGDNIFVDESFERVRRMKPRPTGTFLYRPSRRRYDYVDYTGRFRKQDVDVCDTTFLLESLGLIKFIERVDCDEQSFA